MKRMFRSPARDIKSAAVSARRALRGRYCDSDFTLGRCGPARGPFDRPVSDCAGGAGWRSSWPRPAARGRVPPLRGRGGLTSSDRSERLRSYSSRGVVYACTTSGARRALGNAKHRAFEPARVGPCSTCRENLVAFGLRERVGRRRAAAQPLAAWVGAGQRMDVLPCRRRMSP